MADPTDSNEAQGDRPPVLPYQRQPTAPAVTVRKFYDAVEAQLYANVLEAAGIEYSLLNMNTNTLGAYSAFSQVELQVRDEDAAEARAVLDGLQLDPVDVEPEADPGPEASIPDPAGDGELVPAAAYATPRELYDAAGALGGARIECFLPVLVPRGDRPKGAGNRFVVRVRAGDVSRAREVLAGEAAPEGRDDDEPRCPSCGSWRTYAVPSPWPGLANFLLGRAPEQPRQTECLRCHHRWAAPAQT